MSRTRRAQRVVPIPSTDLDQLRRRIRALAENRPAVYRMVDAAGKIIYVGKAKNLRNRVRSYFQSRRGHDRKTREFVKRIFYFEFIVTDTEIAALVL